MLRQPFGWALTLQGHSNGLVDRRVARIQHPSNIGGASLPTSTGDVRDLSYNNSLVGGVGQFMKRIAIALLAGLAAVAGFSQVASAADLGVKALPQAPALPSWTGFYVGANGGWGWASNFNASSTFTDPTGAGRWGYRPPTAI